MPLTGTGELVATAASGRRGLGAFDVVRPEHARAVVAGAEAARLPVVLQISENTVRRHGGLAPIGCAVLALAEAAAVPVAVHLDRAGSVELVREAVDLGFCSVMFDASARAYEDNVRATSAVVVHCHDAGLWVEAEPGGRNGAHAPGARTDPGEAAAFAGATGVDALAVAVGTSYTMPTRNAALDLPLIAALRAAVPVPLVLHDSSGVPDGLLAEAVRHGVTKVNIGTHHNRVSTAAVGEATAAEVARLLTVLDAWPARASLRTF